MKAQFVYENLNEFNFGKPKINKDVLNQEVYGVNWAHTFNDENVINVIKYKNIPIKLIKRGEYPQKYYAILPIKYFTEHKLIQYYSLKAALNSTKNMIDTYR